MTLHTLPATCAGCSNAQEVSRDAVFRVQKVDHGRPCNAQRGVTYECASCGRWNEIESGVPDDFLYHAPTRRVNL
jgi:hypothetical protein